MGIGEGRVCKRAKNAHAIKYTQDEIDMEAAALTLYEVIQDIRAGRRKPFDIRKAEMVPPIDNMIDEHYVKILASPTPEMTQEYFAVVMYHMIDEWSSGTRDIWNLEDIYMAFYAQIDHFVVLRNGRLHGLNCRYVDNWFVPME